MPKCITTSYLQRQLKDVLGDNIDVRRTMNPTVINVYFCGSYDLSLASQIRAVLRIPEGYDAAFKEKDGHLTGLRIEEIAR
ncbi:hypothetical protein A3K63_02090 [Candidatus Micrarchaeota archaeon RBG_16_49_10]|nr:MAG: hypothetical protein A3K63_02090 [Candidatus Micrarchaeota archaeon RBG_16_49_10]